MNKRTSLRILLLLILLLATWLRWHAIDQVAYSYDEAHITGMAQGVAKMNGNFPLLSGGTTLGVPRGALDVYLLALPLAFSGGRIEAAVWMVGALGTLAVALTFVLGRRISRTLWGDPASRPSLSSSHAPSHLAVRNSPFPAFALLATFYMAANPWLVYFDRRLWAHIQILFSVLMLLLAWQVVVERRSRARFWFPVVAVLQLQSHVLAIVQAMSWLAALLCAPRRWLRPQLLWGSIVALLLLAPYAWALFTRWQASDMSFATRFEPVTESSVVFGNPFFSVSWQMAWQLFSGTGFSSVVGQTEYADWWWQPNRQAAPFLIGLFALAGLIVLLWHAVAAKQEALKSGSRLLLLWMAGPALLFSLRPDEVYLQYWTVLLPLPALFWAAGIESVLQISSQKQWGRQFAIGALVAISTALLFLWGGSYLRVQQRLATGDSITLADWQQSIGETRKLAQQVGTQEIRVAVNGVDPGYDAEPAVIASLIGNPPFARFVAPTTPPSLLFAAEHSSLYFWKIADPATEQLLTTMGELAWQGNSSLGEMDARIYRLPPFAKSDFVYQALSPAVNFDVGLRLIGFQFPQDAQREQPFQVILIWQVLQPSMEVRQRDVTAFNHILDSNDGMAGQIDGLALLSRDWWPGDVLVQAYEMQLPAGNYHWRTGLYSRADGGRSINDAGTDFVDLPNLLIQE